MMDVAMLLNRCGTDDLVEALFFRDAHSMLTQTARQSGLTAERWTIDDYDLSTEDGFQVALQRL